jgi:two-component system sensor histidine kinase/response regulator
MHDVHPAGRMSEERRTAQVKARLLVLDDDETQMRALCRTLELEGYATVGFTSPEDALAALRGESFDLVLTDLTMPRMNGIQFLGAARGIDEQLIGIVMTGHGSVDTAVAAMKAGALDYILKPFTLRMILPVLDRALTIRKLSAENVQLRHSEELIREVNADLEHCVAERTRQLTELNNELEAFSRSISHDLKAPLRAIKGFGGMLAEQYVSSLDARARGYLQRMLDSATRMDGLIDDLMRLSHASAAELKISRVDVSRIAASIIDELRSREPERHVEARIGAHLACECDPQLMRIALENLIGNAWKFTRDASDAYIEVGTCNDRSDTYFVRDNGAGFDSGHAADLFAPFRRFHSNDQFPGTGVGLSIVQRIIRRHGGYLSAEGSVGKGATFYFTVPPQPADAQPGGSMHVS